MKIRRALTFAWRMALAYLRIALSLLLAVIGIAGLAFLVMYLLMLLSQDGDVSNIRVIIRIIAFTAAITGGLICISLVGNILAVFLDILLTPNKIEKKHLYNSVPRYLSIYNRIGLPIFFIGLGSLLNLHLLAMMCWGTVIFITNFASGDISKQAWKKVVDWYELSEQGIKKKKNVPSAEKPKREDTETDGFDIYAADEDGVRLKKLR
jgi:hypothetical protein